MWSNLAQVAYSVLNTLGLIFMNTENNECVEGNTELGVPQKPRCINILKLDNVMCLVEILIRINHN